MKLLLTISRFVTCQILIALFIYMIKDLISNELAQIFLIIPVAVFAAIALMTDNSEVEK